MTVIVVAVFAFAGTRSPDTRSTDDRVFALSGQLKCLQCVGESVAASQAPLATQFRTEIRKQVDTGATDQEVLDYFVRRYGDQVLLTPPSSGAGALVWVLPVLVVGIVAIALGLGFSRRRAAPAGPVPTTVPATGSVAVGVPAAASSAGGPATAGPVGARAPAPRWRGPAIAGVLLVFVVLTGLLVARGSGSRGSNTMTGGSGAGADLGQQLAACQPLAMRTPAKAIPCYDKILGREPDNVEALTYRGWANVRAGNASAGSADLERAVQLNPKYPDARVFRAIVAANGGDFAKASGELALFYANRPSRMATQIVQSEGLERKIFFGLMSAPTRQCWQGAAGSGSSGAIDQAFLTALGACLDGVLAATPADRDARLSRALAHVGPDVKDPAAARALVNGLLADNPADADALALAVSLDIAAGNHDAAAAGLDRLDSLPRGPAAFLIGDPATLREALSAARKAEIPNPGGG